MPVQSHKVLHCLALTAVVAVAAGAHDAVALVAVSAGPRCTSEILPGARDSLTTTLLGRGTRDTLAAGGGDIVRSIWVPRGQVIYGQIVRADSMLGPGADIARRALDARQSTEVVIVPWGNNAGCGIDVWRWSALWLSPDSSGLFSLRLRSESLWVSGRPTFDALFAVNYSYADGPYTVGPHTANGSGGTKLDGGGSMTPVEVFALYAALPPVGQSRDSSAIARLRAWVRANPSARTRYPGSQILQHWPPDPR